MEQSCPDGLANGGTAEHLPSLRAENEDLGGLLRVTKETATDDARLSSTEQYRKYSTIKERLEKAERLVPEAFEGRVSWKPFDWRTAPDSSLLAEARDNLKVLDVQVLEKAVATRQAYLEQEIGKAERCLEAMKEYQKVLAAERNKAMEAMVNEGKKRQGR